MVWPCLRVGVLTTVPGAETIRSKPSSTAAMAIVDRVSMNGRASEGQWHEACLWHVVCVSRASRVCEGPRCKVRVDKALWPKGRAGP